MPNFPNWVPGSLAKLWRDKEAEQEQFKRNMFIYLTEFEKLPEESAVALAEREPRREHFIKLLEKLLLSDEMRSAWASLERLNKNTESKTEGPDRKVINANFRKESNSTPPLNPTAEVVFVQGVYKAQRISIGIETKTPKDRAALLKEIKETAGKLSSLLEDAGPAFDSFPMREAAKSRGEITHDRDKNITTAEVVDLIEDFPDRPGYLSATLGELILSLPDITPPQLVSRPGGVESDRAYFVRSLTNHCRQEFGQPLRRVVLATTITLFDDPNLTERQIIRLAP